MKTKFAIFVLTAIGLVGCFGGEPESLPPDANQTAPPSVTTPAAPAARESTASAQPTASQPAAPTTKSTDGLSGGASASVPAVSAAQQPAPQPAAANGSNMVREKAASGMGKQGRDYPRGLITVPIASYFRAREMIALDKIKHDMELYKALNGDYPRTQEEFMKEIIEAGAITLPALPDGHEYYYDPETGDLMVQRPQ